MGDFGSEFETQASDGIGRKTEAPWLRFFARSMSPDPRHGFYAVIHFAANGTAVFVTVGCGATTWANGELRPLTDEDLHQKTQWAQRVIADRFGSIEPFGDQIDLGARAKLPRAFEKATAVAKSGSPGQLPGCRAIDGTGALIRAWRCSRRRARCYGRVPTTVQLMPWR